MKVECLKEKIKEAVNLAEKVSGKNLTLPILSTLLIEAKDKKLVLKATNLEVGIEMEVASRIEEEGAVCVSANILSNLLSSGLKGDKVTLEAKDGNLKIISENNQSLIKGLSPEDFPLIPKIVEGVEVELASEDLFSGLKSVLFAAAVSDIKPEISSVYIYQNEGNLIFVATDSFRLAEKTIPLSKNLKDFSPLIVPLKNVSEMMRVIDAVSGEVRLVSSKNQLSLYSDSIHFTSRIIDGVYPDYRQIMPSSFKTQVTIEKQEIVDALRLSNIFSDKFNQISLKVKVSDSEMEIESKNQEIGENITKVRGRIEGEDKEMVFNVRYIIDGLGVIGSTSINLKFIETNRPLMIEGVGDESFRYIVMPINR